MDPSAEEVSAVLITFYGTGLRYLQHHFSDGNEPYWQPSSSGIREMSTWGVKLVGAVHLEYSLEQSQGLENHIRVRGDNNYFLPLAKMIYRKEEQSWWEGKEIKEESEKNSWTKVKKEQINNSYRYAYM